MKVLLIMYVCKMMGRQSFQVYLFIFLWHLVLLMVSFHLPYLTNCIIKTFDVTQAIIFAYHVLHNVTYHAEYPCQFSFQCLYELFLFGSCAILYHFIILWKFGFQLFMKRWNWQPQKKGFMHETLRIQHYIYFNIRNKSIWNRKLVA